VLTVLVFASAAIEAEAAEAAVDGDSVSLSDSAIVVRGLAGPSVAAVTDAADATASF
jgi:hypothetical protein